MNPARFALRNLRRNPRRTLITAVALALGVAALVFADAWVRGIGRAIREYATQGRLGALQLNAPGYLSNRNAYPLDKTLPSSGPLFDAIAKVDGVSGAAPRLRFAGTISNGVDETMFLGTAVDAERERTVCPRFLAGELTEGQPPSDSAPLGVVVGTGLAKNLGLKIGSPITLEARTAAGGVNAIDLEVRGIASSSLPDEAKWLVLLPLPTAQKLLKVEGRATSIVVGAKNIDDAQALAPKVEQAATPIAPLEVHTWREVGLYFDQAIRTFGAAQGFLLAVLTLLVMLVIANAQMLAAVERTKEIGTWMALGADRGEVQRVFLSEAALLGLVAGAAGVVLGVLISFAAAAKGIPFKPPNQPQVLVHPEVSFAAAALILFGAAVVTVLGTWIPALLASRRNPVEALSHA